MQTPPCPDCCEEMRALLATSDSVDSDLEQRIAEHLASCATCQRYDGAFSQLLARYRASDLPPLGVALETRLLDRLSLKLHP